MTEVSGNPLRKTVGGNPEGHQAATMTQERYDTLMRAVLDANSQWLAEASDLYEKHDNIAEYQAVQTRIETLGSAVQALAARFPLQSKSWQSRGHD